MTHINQAIRQLEGTYKVIQQGWTYVAHQTFATMADLNTSYFAGTELAKLCDYYAFSKQLPVVFMIHFRIKDDTLFVFDVKVHTVVKNGLNGLISSPTQEDFVIYLATHQLRKDAGLPPFPEAVRAEEAMAKIKETPVPEVLHGYRLILPPCVSPFLKKAGMYGNSTILHYSAFKQDVHDFEIYLDEQSRFRISRIPETFTTFFEAFSFLDALIKKNRLHVLMQPEEKPNTLPPYGY